MRWLVVRRLMRMLHGERRLMMVSVVFRVLNQTLAVVIPATAVALVIDSARGGRSGVVGPVFALIALALVKGLCRYLEQFTGHAVAFRLLARLRSSVFRWLERVEPARLDDERSGDLTSRVSGDIDRVEPFFAHTIAPGASAVLVPLVVLAGLAVFVDPTPALTLTPFVLLYLLIVPWLGGRRSVEDGLRSRALVGETAAAVGDIVQGAEEIAVLDAAPKVRAAMERSDARLAAAGYRLARGAARRSLVGGLIAGGAVVAVLLVSTWAGLGIEVLGVAVVVAWTVMAPLRALDQVVSDAEQAIAAAARLFTLEDLETQSDGETATASGEIRFEAVTVVAGSDRILDSIYLTIEERSLLGIVGPSGSGKSTLVSTLVRHRDPTSGRLLLGDEVVRNISRSQLRRSVTLVPQRPDVFFGTLAENLLIARPDARQDDLYLALDRARLVDWVRGLDRGLETPIGERGVGMSGGQVQRLALARAFLRDPAVLILDEATSELDMATERSVLDEVFTARGKKTLIVVAHRMETVIDADLIAVMSRGRVVETGTHDQLRSAGGLYASLWERHLDLVKSNGP